MYGAVTELWWANPDDDTDMALAMWPRISSAGGVMYLELEFDSNELQCLLLAAPSMRDALREIAAKARFEQDSPTDLHMTCLSLIEKTARAALES